MENNQTESKRKILSVLKNLWLLLLLIPVALLAVSGTVAAQVADNEFSIQLQLDGKSEIELEYGAEFEDPGATAQVAGTILVQEPESLDITVSGFVDTDRVGTYSLVYSATFGDLEKAQIRTVYVVDKTPPVIKLESDPDSYTLPGDAYEEEGYTAYDAYDGDLTDKVTREERGGYVYYSVKDSSGNEAKISRKIVYNDVTAPKVMPNGPKSIVIYQGSSYREYGCCALDDVCGDVSARVTVSGAVDVNKVGSYVLTYQAEDDYGNVGTAQRIVHVAAWPTSEKVIYLTFDDGPSGYTNQLLDVLKKYDVKATFFLVKTGFLPNAKRIVNEGHAVGIHSITHDYDTIYASEDAFFQDLYGMQKLIKDHTGVTTYLMRFPGGSSNKVSSFNPGIMTRLVKQVEAAGFQYFDWNVSSGDTSKLTSEQISQNIIRGIRSTKKAVVLQHDIYLRSVDAVEAVILWGLENGYTFAALDHGSPTAHHGLNN